MFDGPVALREGCGRRLVLGMKKSSLFVTVSIDCFWLPA
jgi:hypothetical protein